MEFATGALGTLLPKLGQLLQDEYNLHKGVKKNIKFLSRELESIRAALRHVGEVPPEQLSELVKIWARDDRELSYDMEDVVDTFLVRVQGPDPPSKKSSKKFIKKMKDIFTKVKTRHEIGQEIKDIKELVKEVAERRDRSAYWPRYRNLSDTPVQVDGPLIHFTQTQMSFFSPGLFYIRKFSQRTIYKRKDGQTIQLAAYVSSIQKHHATCAKIVVIQDKHGTSACDGVVTQI